mmetsp:Transcript_43198/g.88402  ORF Transcript_43198/g.88402 Transcript_43198/m.88402 type:complete len:200 (-) Transcript_43198:349-948(-)
MGDRVLRAALARTSGYPVQANALSARVAHIKINPDLPHAWNVQAGSITTALQTLQTALRVPNLPPPSKEAILNSTALVWRATRARMGGRVRNARLERTRKSKDLLLASPASRIRGPHRAARLDFIVLVMLATSAPRTESVCNAGSWAMWAERSVMMLSSGCASLPRIKASRSKSFQTGHTLVCPFVLPFGRQTHTGKPL